MKKIMCNGRCDEPGLAGGHSHSCPFKAKYKITHKGFHDKDYEMEGYTVYLCGIHFKGRGYNPHETIVLLKNGSKVYI